MKNTEAVWTADYNGEPLRPGEVMVPFAYSPLDAESCRNPACIRTVRVGGRKFRVIYKAVPEQWARTAVSALSLVENEALGHYARKNTIALDEMAEKLECRQETMEAPETPEDRLLSSLEREETRSSFTALLSALLDRSARLGYAVLLCMTGTVGEEFYRKMKLSRSAANAVQQQARAILQRGLIHLDLSTLRCSRSRYEAEYREEAEKLLRQLTL